MELLDETERRRRAASALLEPKRRARLGQFFTDARIAAFIAALPRLAKQRHLDLLDPGAGVGSLGAAMVARILLEAPVVRSIRVVAYELDRGLHGDLAGTGHQFADLAAGRGVSLIWEIRGEDYIDAAAGALAGRLGGVPEAFDLVVMNPPYRKIATASAERRALETVGLSVVNLYTAFLALGAAQLKAGGQIAAITPRSFSNGSYYAPFRDFFLQRVALDRVHVYESRSAAFADAEVLQENVILCGTRDGLRRSIRLSISAGPGAEPTVREVPYAEVIVPDDPLRFVRLPVDGSDAGVAQRIASLGATLADLDVSVSTGRVVDFRSREALRSDPGPDTVALIYPSHLVAGAVAWPLLHGRKANAIVRSADTERLLLPNEPYVLVKRFSAKEERRRVCAALSLPGMLPGTHVAYENHLNVFHRDRRGLPVALAAGLYAYLNSSVLDRFVRQFNGHTQINATDLRQLRYPTGAQLAALGERIAATRAHDQEAIDAAVVAAVPELAEAADPARKAA